MTHFLNLTFLFEAFGPLPAPARAVGIRLPTPARERPTASAAC